MRLRSSHARREGIMQAATLPNPAVLMDQDAVAVVATARHSGEPLLPDEARYVAARGMQPRRAAEFRTGRACARQALAQFGFRNWPLLPTPTREPRWPEGLVGSITHADDYCAAAVARARSCAGLGIDVETIGRVSPAIAALICTENELLDAAARRGRLPTALRFSAKESVFKAVFPHTRVIFEPSDIEIEFDLEKRSFRTRAPGQAALDRVCARIEGRFAIGPTHVMTTAWLQLPREGAPTGARAARESITT
jgi:4'-phosphopantetheinyl transferase EntD